MNFKVDENLPLEIAGLLEAAGYDAATVLAEGLQGQPDSTVVEVSAQEGRVLVTLDLGFADIRAYPPDQYAGFIVLRPRWQDKPHLLDLFRQILPLLQQQPLEHHLWIVEETRVRIRGGDPG